MARDHGFHPVRIKRVIQETPDARTFVLDAPFSYRAGQFLTLRICGTLRSYSLSSSPDADDEPATTVKRVPGGLVSNWMHDHLGPGDVVESTLPAGVFCLRESDAPLVAFCGGSGITPIMSLVKSALATTGRRVRVLAADRDADSVIFASALAELAGRHPGRFEIRHHLDAEQGLVTEAEVRAFAGGDLDADFYLCGPAPFMDLVERVLLDLGVAPERILVERFEQAAADDEPAGEETGGTVTIVLNGRRHTVPQHSGESLLESARRAGLAPPFSCEAGNCATCIAQVTEGEAKMRVNNALDEDEVADGWVLTCQGEPVTPHLTVVYDD
ncbi:ferredoxin--NADP reductase [Thermomonospora cellulosilytica]|uniref:Ferredoxin-NADP reductase n=1 Tax=Thermomonospora cellulosilytica TaxID=1411118 RepID=A0A7W3R9I5_9ACTN|nr:ferredoxin--NADP reductase [Thermomonospora cellulosilytica]MBA9005398.1 ferredoxin-NADP reductase [Thermomonospora cellulosilytica]